MSEAGPVVAVSKATATGLQRQRPENVGGGQNPTETREAIDVTAVVLPTSDITEPQAL